MGDTAEDAIPRLHKSLLDLASSSGQALDVLAKANYDIVSAGFADVASSAELMGVSAQLAVGGVTEVSTAADLLTTALNSYKLTADDAMETSDKLFTIVRLGKTTISEIAHSFGMASAIAGPAGVSIEELGAAMAVLTTEGQNTNIATTAIRATIVELMKPTQELKKEFDNLGTGFNSLAEYMGEKGFAATLALVRRASEESGKPLKDLFGNIRALMAVMPLAGASFDKFNDFLVQMKDSGGATTKAYELMQKTWVQNWKKFKMNLNRILIEIGDALITVIQPYVEDANKVLEELGDIGWGNVTKAIIDNFSELGAPINSVFKYTGALAMEGFEAGWNSMGGDAMVIDLIMKPFKWMWKQMRLGWINAVGQMATEVALPMERMLVIGFYKGINAMKDFARETLKLIPKAWVKIGEVIAAFNKNLVIGFGNALIWMISKVNALIDTFNNIPGIDIEKFDTKGLAEKFEVAGTAIESGMIDKMKSMTDAVNKGIDEMIGGHHDIEDLEEFYNEFYGNLMFKWSDTVAEYLETQKGGNKKSGELYDEMLAEIDAFYKKVKQSAIKNAPPVISPSGAPTGGDTYAGDSATPQGPQPLEISISPLQTAMNKAGEITSSFWEGFKANAAEGSSAQAKSFQAMANKYAQVGKSIIGVGDAMLNMELTNADEARKVQMKNLDEKLEQGIITDEQYASAKEKIDNQMEAKMKAAKNKHKKWAIAEALINGALAIVKAYATLGPILGTIAAIALAVTTGIQIATINAQTFAKGGLVKGMAKGGPAGYGTDIVPAMLTPGEYVMKKSAVDKYGTTFFEKLNKFQEGGVVTSGGGDASEISDSKITVNIQAIDAKSFYEWVAEDPEGLAKAINILTDRDYISMYNSGGKVQVTTPYGTGGL